MPNKALQNYNKQRGAGGGIGHIDATGLKTCGKREHNEVNEKYNLIDDCYLTVLSSYLIKIVIEGNTYKEMFIER